MIICVSFEEIRLLVYIWLNYMKLLRWKLGIQCNLVDLLPRPFNWLIFLCVCFFFRRDPVMECSRTRHVLFIQWRGFGRWVWAIKRCISPFIHILAGILRMECTVSFKPMVKFFERGDIFLHWKYISYFFFGMLKFQTEGSTGEVSFSLSDGWDLAFEGITV